MPSGYASTPLAKKLGIKSGFSILIHNAPEHYFDLFSDWPTDTHIPDLVMEESIDFIHLFCTSFEKLQAITTEFKAALKKDGALWISWPKGKSNIPTNLKRDMIREHLLANGLVDVKVAAIDEDWSGLKFVYRKKDR